MADMRLFFCLFCFSVSVEQGHLTGNEAATPFAPKINGLEKEVHRIELKEALDDMMKLVHKQNQRLEQQETIIQELLKWKHQQYEKEKTFEHQIEYQKAELDEIKVNLNQQIKKTQEQEVTIQQLLRLKVTQTGPENLNEDNTGQGQEAETTGTAVPYSAIKQFKTGQSIAKRLVLGTDETVAFHAVNNLMTVPHLGIHQKIIFETVRLNLGAGYHNQQGVFIAPAPGIYIFSTSVMSKYDQTGSFVEVALVKNGATLAAAYASSPPAKTYDQGSVSVVVQLVAGDELWVENRYHADLAMYGDDYSSFMGCLILPL